jgi:hypothetical protein
MVNSGAGAVYVDLGDFCGQSRKNIELSTPPFMTAAEESPAQIQYQGRLCIFRQSGL